MSAGKVNDTMKRGRSLCLRHVDGSSFPGRSNAERLSRPCNSLSWTWQNLIIGLNNRKSQRWNQTPVGSYCHSNTFVPINSTELCKIILDTCRLLPSLKYIRSNELDWTFAITLNTCQFLSSLKKSFSGMIQSVCWQRELCWGTKWKWAYETVLLLTSCRRELCSETDQN